jgi:hypothetical protein
LVKISMSVFFFPFFSFVLLLSVFLSYVCIVFVHLNRWSIFD